MEVGLTRPEPMSSLMTHKETVTMCNTLFLSPGGNTSSVDEIKTDVPTNMNIGQRKQYKIPFSCSVMRGHHRYLEETFTDR